MNCVKHKIVMERKDKKGRFYHWVEGMDKVMCYGLYQVDLNQMNREPITPPVPTTDEVTEQITAEEAVEMLGNTMKEPKPEMTSEEKMWRDKEDRQAEREKIKNDQIRRLTLAKSCISQGIDIDVARQNNDLELWDHWVETGDFDL